MSDLPVDTFQQFVAAINSQDVEALTALMTPDHVFVDSLGNRVQGAKLMQAGWSGYFTMCPHYRIQADHVIAEGAMVLAVGHAGGTIDATSWRTPAAWKAVVRNRLISEWQVFADNKPVYEILTGRPTNNYSK